MNLVEIDNKIVKQYVEFFVPKEILKLKPIIAGGFVLALYNTIIRYSQSEKAINDIKKSLENKNPMFMAGSSFTDIDFWFLKDNEIWDKDCKFNALVSTNEAVKNYYDDNQTLISSQTITIGNPVILGNGSSYSPINVGSASNTTKIGINGSLVPSHITVGGYNVSPKKFYVDPLSKELSESLELHSHAQKSSYFANDFILTKRSVYSSTAYKGSLQFIKHPQESIESLLSSFDIENCKIAYYDGKVYMSDKISDLFDDRKILLCPSKKSLAGRMFTFIRLKKYCTRYNLTMNRADIENFLETMIEVSHANKDLSEKEQAKVPTYFDNSNFIKMQDGFYSLIDFVENMPEFRKEDYLLLVSVNHHFIKNKIAKFFFEETKNILPSIHSSKYEDF